MADTSGNLGVQYDGSSAGTKSNASAVNSGSMVLLTNKSGGDVVTGDVLVLDTTTASCFTTTTTVGDLRPVYVVPANVTGNNVSATKTIAADEAGWVYKPGAIVPAAKVSAAVAFHEYLKVSATTKSLVGTGVASGAAVPVPSGACAVALEAAAAAGTIAVQLLGRTETFGIADKTEKTEVVDDDLFIIADSEASNALKSAKVKNILRLAHCRYIKTTDQTISTSPVGVTFADATGAIDTDSFHSTSTNTTRFTVPVTGLYNIHFSFTGSSFTTYVFVDGVEITPVIRRISGNGSDTNCSLYLTAGQYIEMFASRSSSGDMTHANFAMFLVSGGA